MKDEVKLKAKRYQDFTQIQTLKIMDKLTSFQRDQSANEMLNSSKLNFGSNQSSKKPSLRYS